MTTNKPSRPLGFTVQSVRDICAGLKTKTRRVMVPQPVEYSFDGEIEFTGWQKSPTNFLDSVHSDFADFCPYGKVGDLLWVREPWAITHDPYSGFYVHYVADRTAARRIGAIRMGDWLDQHRKEIGSTFKPRSSLFMPKWAARLFLEITEIRWKRVQEILEADIFAEGIRKFDYGPDSSNPAVNAYAYGLEKLALGAMEYTPQNAFRRAWDDLNARRGYSWESNPFVWVIGFKRVDA